MVFCQPCASFNMVLLTLQGIVVLATLIDSRQGMELGEAAVLEARQVAEGHQCPSATVRLTTAGVSLMQAASLSSRVMADQLSDEDLTDDSMLDKMVAADRRAHRHAGVGKHSGKLSAQTYTTTSLAAPPAGVAKAVAAANDRELNHTSLAVSASEIVSRQPAAENPLLDGGIPDPPMSFVSELAQRGHLAAKTAALAASNFLKGDAGELDQSLRTFIAGILILAVALVLYVLTMHPEALGNCCPGSGFSRDPLGEPDYSQSYEADGGSDGVDNSDEAEVTFCPDLIVPRDRECVLYVPVLSEAAKSDAVVFKDANGEAVLRAVAPAPSQKSFMSFSSSQKASSAAWQVTLATASGTSLAQCCEVSGGSREYQLLGPKGEFFGSLSKNDERDAYILNTSCGRHFRFWGNFDEQAINVTSDKGRLLATSEVSEPDFDKTGSFVRLRIAPLVDAGIVLCSLLCIRHHLG
mmetsp:Transcript_60327/g.113880  ORF Transcript_60327/g.113880 Transcript_60327/m.113880 type:complete len:467 (+) Transcript_60327:163-1563(+)